MMNNDEKTQKIRKKVHSAIEGNASIEASIKDGVLNASIKGNSATTMLLLADIIYGMADSHVSEKEKKSEIKKDDKGIFDSIIRLKIMDILFEEIREMSIGWVAFKMASKMVNNKEVPEFMVMKAVMEMSENDPERLKEIMELLNKENKEK